MSRSPRRTLPRQPRIALAEDDDDQRQALEAALVAEGFEVISFEDGAELLDYFEAEGGAPADVIVADLHMPGCSGLEGLERARARGVRVPIFVVTGSNAPEVQARLSQLGNMLFFQKPVDPERLAAAISSVASVLRETP